MTRQDSDDSISRPATKAAKKKARNAVENQAMEAALQGRRESRIESLTRRIGGIGEFINHLRHTNPESEGIAQKENTRRLLAQQLSNLLDPNAKSARLANNLQRKIDGLQNQMPKLESDAKLGSDADNEKLQAAQRELRGAQQALRKLLPKEERKSPEGSIEKRPNQPRPTKLDRLIAKASLTRDKAEMAQQIADATDTNDPQKWLLIKRASTLESAADERDKIVAHEKQKVATREAIALEKAEEKARRKAEKKARRNNDSTSSSPSVSAAITPTPKIIKTPAPKPTKPAKEIMDTTTPTALTDGEAIDAATPPPVAPSEEEVNKLADKFRRYNPPKPRQKPGDLPKQTAENDPTPPKLSPDQLLEQILARQRAARDAAARADGPEAYAQWVADEEARQLQASNSPRR